MLFMISWGLYYPMIGRVGFFDDAFRTGNTMEHQAILWNGLGGFEQQVGCYNTMKFIVVG
jgi:hypothetical protein